MSAGPWTPALAQLLVSYGCVLVIPGPNAFVVIAASCDRFRHKASVTAASVAAGATAAAALAASGAALVPQGPAFQALGGIAVALILLRSALRIGRGAGPRPLPAAAPGTGLRSFILGFGVASSNPMSIAYFASFFLAHSLRGLDALPACGTVFLMAAAWFLLLGSASRRLGTVLWPTPLARVFRLGAMLGLVSLASRSLWRIAFVG